MLPFGVTLQATVPQGSEIPEGLMNNPIYICIYMCVCVRACVRVCEGVMASDLSESNLSART